MYKFVFDVDGTLTASRKSIDADFAEFFKEFCKFNSVFLVSGSDLAKTREQLGQEILNQVDTIFSCSGNEVWKNAKLIHSNIWNPDKDVIAWLENRLSLSGFKPKTGNHIETRTGCLNFSIVGRNASLSDRYAYIDWDIKHSERESIAVEFNHTFLELEARLGGETGIDIYPKGYDKSQIIKYFSTVDRIMFFGDKMNPGGNDYPLKSAIENNRLGECFPVKDWKHTYKILSVMKVSI